MPPQQYRIIKEVKIFLITSREGIRKRLKTIGEQGKKQVEAIEE